jgi:hypothetical protein
MPECATSLPFSSCNRYRHSTNEAGWAAFRCCRIHARSTSTADSQSRPEAGSQSPGCGSDDCRVMHSSDAPRTCSAICDCFEALDSAPFHHMLIKRKYRLLFSPNARRRPAPKGPEKELINAVVEMKRRNPTWGCPRIAAQITLAFGIDIDKDVVRRILGMHYRPESGSGGPSWLTFLGHAKDSLWSADLFCCESLTLRRHWVWL